MYICHTGNIIFNEEADRGEVLVSIGLHSIQDPNPDFLLMFSPLRQPWLIKSRISLPCLLPYITELCLYKSKLL